MYYISNTLISKDKGDEGIYAAIAAARLARALRGATISRLALQERLRTAAKGDIMLAPPPQKFDHASVEEIKRATMRELFINDPDVADYENQVVVGLPDELQMDDLKEIIHLIRRVSPETELGYVDLMRLLSMLHLHGSHITTLELGGVVAPQSQPETPAKVLQDHVLKLRERYPLPTRKPKNIDVESDDEDDEDPEELQHNAELRARCERLQIPYTDYPSALMDLALHDTRVFLLLCNFLCADTTLKVVRLHGNAIGAESRKTEGAVDLVPIRALARVIDLNETMKVLDLSDNRLGPNGIGILAKALTKNISLVMVDLSANAINAEPLEELEDPEYEEEDPMFGEIYSGLEAISEVLKKNKFLRILRLAHNGIHGGDDLTTPAPEEEVLADFHPDEDAMEPEAADNFEDLPLWKLVSPLMKYHRLKVLDLTGNQLKSQGARILATALHKNHSLEVLDLTDNAIGFRGLHYIANLVIASAESRLHTLIVRRNDLAGKKTSRAQQKAALAAMRAFSRAMDGNRTVRRLIFSSNHLGSALSAALLENIGRAEVLEELDFSFNEACGEHVSSFDPSVAHALASALYMQHRNSRPTLRTLRISGNHLGVQGMSILFPPSFAPPHVLREVDLSRNDIGDHVLPLCSFLQVSTTIERIDLSHNGISSLHPMLPGLRSNDTLQELDLSHNKLGSQEGIHCNPEVQVRELAEVLSAMALHRTLRVLDLSWNDLREPHGELVLAAFAPHDAAQHLQKLDLSNNPKIPTSRVREVVQRIASRPGMEVVYASVPAKEARSEAASLLGAMEEVVGASPSLLDVSCGLAGAGGSVREDEEDEIIGKKVGTLRRKLLLNALLSTAKKVEES